VPIRLSISIEAARQRYDSESALIPPLRDASAKDPANLEALFREARTLAGLLSVFDPESSEIPQLVQLAAQSAVAIFANGSSDISHAGNWRNGFFAAVIGRHRDSLDQLCATPSVVWRSSTTRGDECLNLFNEALQALGKRDPRASAPLLAALKATDPALLRISPEDFVLNIIVPEIQLVYRFIAGERQGFQEALDFAIERHSRYWSRAGRERDPLGYLAWGPIAIASLAADAGWVIETSSDYLPLRLVHRPRST
jgi:hypothetical protein